MTEPLSDFGAQTEALTMKIRELVTLEREKWTDQDPNEQRSQALTALIRAMLDEAFEHLDLAAKPFRIRALTDVISDEINERRRRVRLTETKPATN